MRVLVIYASADGSTAGIAERIAVRLRHRGHHASLHPVGEAGSVEGADAVVLGSAVHARRWLDEATAFVDTHHLELRDRPLWTFSVGMPDALPRWARRLARREEEAVMVQLGDLRPVSHRLFSGVVAPGQFPPASRLFLRLTGARYGDFRDWASIEGWADEIAGRLDDTAGEAADRARRGDLRL